jgi:signal recognition particle subunit SRP54
VLLAALDVYRPAAIKQLQVNGEKVGVDVFEMGENQSPVDIARAAVEYAKKNSKNVLILDTAGRLHVDEEMMQELKNIKAAVEVTQTLLVVDAMTGQDAVNVASSFNDEIGVDGIILSKLDGDARGGAALSCKAVTGKPIIFAGMGEKLTDLDQFYPDRMASRILGMGDVLSLIEQVSENAIVDEEKEKDMAARMKKGKFDFNDYLESMKMMRKMGGLGSILGMMPLGGGVKKSDLEDAIDEKELARMEAIVLSMTPKERSNPKILNPRRKNRIAKGAGVDISVVNRFIKQFEQTQKMMKQMPGLMGGKRGRMRFPF